MAQHKRKKSPAEQQLPAQLHAVNLHAAGIDVGAEAHWVAVPVEADPQPDNERPGLVAWHGLVRSTPNGTVHRQLK